TTAPVSWGQGSTTASLASSLASAINAAAGAVVSASASGATVNLLSISTGSNVNYSLSAAVTDTQRANYPTLISGPSFAAAMASMVGGTAGSAPANALVYSYNLPSSGGYDSAGNLLSVNDSVNGWWTYGYDSLNRMTAGTATSGPRQGQNGCWAYDAFGNRTAESYQTASCGNLTATASYNANNKVTWTPAAVNGFTYDAAGNVLNDGVNSYLYDPEGRLCEVASTGPSFTAYFYDAEGHRVAKGALSSWQSSCPAPSAVTGQVTSYEIGLGGEQMTEANLSTHAWTHTNVFAAGKLLATYRDSNVYFALTDWLGTKRAEVGGNGCLETFQELAYGNGLVQVDSPKPCVDATEHHFTGKERDTETGFANGNDYFG